MLLVLNTFFFVYERGVPWRVTNTAGGWIQHLSYEERLGEQGWLEKRWLLVQKWKEERLRLDVRQTSSPQGEASSGTGCSQSLSNLCLWGFSGPDWMKPWASRSHLTAAQALSWGFKESFLSSLPTCIILKFVCLFSAKLLYFTCSILKLPDLRDTPPPPPH